MNEFNKKIIPIIIIVILIIIGGIYYYNQTTISETNKLEILNSLKSESNLTTEEKESILGELSNSETKITEEEKLKILNSLRD